MNFASLWGLDPSVSYLNHGSFGACPSTVLAVQAALRLEMEREPVDFLSAMLPSRLNEARQALADFLSAAPEDLVFVPNATTAVNAVLRSLSFEPGDELLLTNHTYAACRKTAEFVAERTGARLVVAHLPFPCNSPEEIIASIMSCVSSRTRLALLDHVTSPTALVLPIARLVDELRTRGVDTLVDGAHAPGMVALGLSDLGAAYYTGNAHKWLCAPKGAAFLHVRRDRQTRLHPSVISHGYTAGFHAEFDWTGTLDPTPWLCIPESIRFMGGLLPAGWPQLMETNHALALRARTLLLQSTGGVTPCPESMIGSMAAVPLPQAPVDSPAQGLDCKGLHRWFRERGIETWIHPNPMPLLRISAQLYNQLDQFRELANLLEEAFRARWRDLQSIKARLSTFDIAMVVFSLVVGIGIFRTPAIVAGAAGSSSLFFAAWIAGGLISLIGALIFAEIGSRYPRAGGYYRVVADCYHPTLAFMLNWSQTLMQGAGAAGVAFIGADYLAPVLLPPEWRTPHASLILACATMLLMLWLNYRGVKPGARVQNLLSILKIVMIIGLACFALMLAPRAHIVQHVSTAPVGLRLASALIPCFYAYGGYQLTMNLGADLKDARRRFPLAITAGMFTVVALYLVLNFAYQRVLGIDGIANSTLAAAALSRATFGPSGEVLVSIAVFLSAAGFVNATIIQMPRSFYAMAQDGVLPRAFLRVNPDSQVQEVGLLFFGATMLLPALLLKSFEKLLDYVIFTDTLTLAVVASTLFVLRRRHTGDGGFSMWGYPLLPAIYILCLVGVAARVFSLEPRLALAGIVILLTGWPLFRLGHRLFAG